MIFHYLPFAFESFLLRETDLNLCIDSQQFDYKIESFLINDTRWFIGGKKLIENPFGKIQISIDYGGKF